MRGTTFGWLVAAGFALTLGACWEPERPPGASGGGAVGGGGGGGGGSAVPIGDGLDPAASMSALTDAEAAAYCAQVAAASEAALGDPTELACTLMGMLIGAFTGGDDPVGACESTRTLCLADPPDEAEGLVSCTLEDPAERAACDVTVAEASTCLEDTLALWEANPDAVSCAALGDPDAEPLADPASCDGLEPRCPALFGD